MFFVANRKNRHLTSEGFFFFSEEKLARLFLLKDVNPSPERKIIKLRTCNNLFPPLTLETFRFEDKDDYECEI